MGLLLAGVGMCTWSVENDEVTFSAHALHYCTMARKASMISNSVNIMSSL